MKANFFTGCILLLLSGFSAMSQNPEVIIPIGHTNSIEIVRFTNDGKYILSGSSDNTIKLWELATGNEIKTYEQHTGSINAFSMFSDGKRFISAASDKKLYIWNLLTGEIEKEFLQQSFKTIFLQILPGDKQFIIANWNKSIRICNLETGETEFKLEGHTKTIKSVAMSNNSKYLLTYGYDKKMLLWNVGKRSIIKTISVEMKMKPSLAVSNNGKFAVASVMKDTFHIWDLTKGIIIKTVEGHKRLVNNVYFSPDNKNIITNSWDKTIAFWNMNGEKQKECNSGIYTVNDIKFSPDGKYFVSCSTGKTIKLYETEKARLVRIFKGYSANVTGLKISPDGKYLISGGNNRNLQFWNFYHAKIVKTMKSKSFFIDAIDFSPDGKYVMTNEWPRDVAIWKLRNEKQIKALKGHKAGVYAVKYSTGGDTAYSVDKKGGAIMWDVKKGKQLNKIQTDTYLFPRIKISPNGKQFAIGDTAKTVRIHSFTDTTLIRSLDGINSSIVALEYMPDGSQLITGASNKQINFWDAVTGENKRTIQSNDFLSGTISVSPNQQFIAWTFKSDKIKVWDLISDKVLHTLNNHKKRVSSIAFSVDNKYIISGSHDHTISISDLKTGMEVVKFIAINPSDWIAITPDNYYSCSKNVLNKMCFRIGLKTYNFEQFDFWFNRPDIVLERLGYASPELIKAYHNAYLKRLKKMNFSEDMFSSEWHVPEIKITNSYDIPLSTTNASINISIAASDKKYKLDRINLWINDIPAYGVNGINLREAKIQNFDKKLKIDLSNGLNKIQVSTHNENGVESIKQTIYITHILADASETKPNLYLLTIGVSEYADSLFNLEYAAKDANDIADLFKNQQTSFNEIHIINLTNNEVTKQNIINQKEKLLKTNVNDVVIVFFAGHGLLNDNLDYYLATYDIDFTSPSKNGLAYEELEHLLDNIPARNKLLLIDACHSGEVDKEEIQLIAQATKKTGKVKFRDANPKGFKPTAKLGVNQSFELMKELFADLRRGCGAVVISSAGGVEFAYESDKWNNGVFTYSLIEGIRTKKADKNKDKNISVSELKDYVAYRVRELTNGQQNPTSRRENVEFDFIINR